MLLAASEKNFVWSAGGGGMNFRRKLVEQRLAACVQVIGPMTSHYRWQGKIEAAGEYLCLAKSRAALYSEIEAAIKAIHPYEVAEIVAVPIIAGSREYLAWLTAAVKEPS